MACSGRAHAAMTRRPRPSAPDHADQAADELALGGVKMASADIMNKQNERVDQRAVLGVHRLESRHGDGKVHWSSPLRTASGRRKAFQLVTKARMPTVVGPAGTAAAGSAGDRIRWRRLRSRRPPARRGCAHEQAQDDDHDGQREGRLRQRTPNGSRPGRSAAAAGQRKGHGVERNSSPTTISTYTPAAAEGIAGQHEGRHRAEHHGQPVATTATTTLLAKSSPGGGRVAMAASLSAPRDAAAHTV